MTKISCDILVVGAGLVGAPLALALAANGLAVAVVDRGRPIGRTPPRPDGRSSAIALAAQRLYEAIDLWPDVAPFAAPILEIRVADRASPLHLHYHHADVGDEPLGWIAENHLLLGALRRRLAAAPGVTRLAPAEIGALTPDAGGVTATLKDGRQIRAALVVAADGRSSAVRALAGIGTLRHDYRQAGIVCTVAHEKDHRNVAQEHFLPSGPFAILPLPGHRSSVVWTEKAHLAPAIVAASDERFRLELGRRFGSYLGALTLEGPRFSYPLSVQVARAATAERVVLVGDALHGMHPVAGQGMNMGLRDVAALTEAVVTARRLGLDIGTRPVLERYARWRRFDNLLMLGLTDGLVRLFSNDWAPVAWSRDLGLAAVDRARPLKRFFIRHAMGVVGALPRLLAGEKL